MYSDVGFKIFKYDANKSLFQNGQAHGEEFKKQIHELAKIREDLMLMKSPHLKDHLAPLAKEQIQSTKEYDESLLKELEGISDGADIEMEKLVILNNYTDFRDIQLPEEGCTSLFIKDQDTIAAQTWDMHSSAKNYLIILDIPEIENTPAMKVFTLTGCLGMMGVNSHGLFLGVNNINTKNAQAQIIWPAIVRRALFEKELVDMNFAITGAKVTSGHNYLIADEDIAYNLEVAPTAIDTLELKNNRIFHTNHCLSQIVKEQEIVESISSTTHAREEIVLKHIDKLKTQEDVTNLLQSHEGYPKSICSHYQSGAADPSTTCGGGVYNFKTKNFYLWRGCKEYDDNFIERELII